MENLPKIALETDWQCEYFELDPELYEFASDYPVPHLSTWTFDRRRSEEWAAWLHRTFSLEPTDTCVRYLLLIDSAPQQAGIYLNGQRIATYEIGDDDPPFELDVTDQVWLDDNIIAFRVERDSRGTFEDVCLVAVECES